MAKLGCLAEGCCFGKPCAWPWAITFSASDDAPIGTPLHPTQIYEILVLAVIWSAFRLLPADRWRGTILAWFVLLYGVGRSLVETFRGDTTVQPRALGLSDSQLIMLAGVVIALVVLMAKRKPPAAPTDPPATP
jgi:phosphatidylglycerol:prolipoprotein diacylglycerol transferase